jgi:hypothetical protein
MASVAVRVGRPGPRAGRRSWTAAEPCLRHGPITVGATSCFSRSLDHGVITTHATSRQAQVMHAR